MTTTFFEKKFGVAITEFRSVLQEGNFEKKTSFGNTLF